MKIDKNIPLPSLKHSKYLKLYEEMKIGDSVFFSRDTCNFRTYSATNGTTQLQCREADSFNKGLNRLIKKKGLTNLTTAIRKVDNGVRVWLYERLK